MTRARFSVFRCVRRLVRFGVALVRAGVSAPRAGSDVVVLARWVQTHARSLADALEMSLHVRGVPPHQGMVVSNHVSYLDILALGSAAPMAFVAKSEVQSWPVLGWLAARGGTLFIRRGQRTDVKRLSEAMGATLRAGVPAVFFPEGTSSGGETVLRFHSSLLEPAVSEQAQVTPAAVGYRLAGGSVAAEVCYWGEMTFLPHFLRLAGLPAVEAFVEFGELNEPGTDRKALAGILHGQVTRLHAGLLPCGIDRADRAYAPREPSHPTP